MKTTKLYLTLFIVLTSSISCSQLKECSKKIIGTSTASLENARVDAISKTFNCSFDECFEAVLSLARDDEDLKPVTKKSFDIFLKDRIESHIVVMGVVGHVDTTTVGIFFDKEGADSYKIDVSSHSNSAKRKVAEAVFAELGERF